MKKSIVFLVCLCFVVLQQGNACTTFLINKNGQLVFGRNYDWMTAAGMVCTNLRGLEKTSMTLRNQKTISWVSKYGSITFNQYGKEFPTGGMNEKGLVVELMWAAETQYPAPDDRPDLNVLQWVQYQLDNNSTVEEVLSSDKVVRISRNGPPLHYLVADANGNAATIEFYDGKLVAHTGKDLPFPVLTNSTYVQSAKTAVDANILAGNTNFSIRDNSLQRFTKACSMVQQYQTTSINKPVADYAFDILNNVSQQDYTKWSIVYDLKNKKIYFKTYGYKDVKSVAFDAFDFSCTAQSKATNMNQSLKGDISKELKPFDIAINRLVVTKAVEESKEQVPMSNEERDAIIAYGSAVKCKN
jgi:penicillin V acylase-like amidase (Ntn superfamily)